MEAKMVARVLQAARAVQPLPCRITLLASDMVRLTMHVKNATHREQMSAWCPSPTRRYKNGAVQATAGGPDAINHWTPYQLILCAV